MARQTDTRPRHRQTPLRQPPPSKYGVSQALYPADQGVQALHLHCVSATKPGGFVVNQIAAALVERIVRAGKEGTKIQVVKTKGSIKTIWAAQYRSINRVGSSIYDEVRKAGFDPLNLHSGSDDKLTLLVNNVVTGIGFFKQMEDNSSVKFHEAQVALSRQWVAGDELTTQMEIINAIPQEESLAPADKSKAQTTEKLWTRFRSILLAVKTSLFDEERLGTEEEELNADGKQGNPNPKRRRGDDDDGFARVSSAPDKE
ncbi:hypothetical protein GALMADRAFT_217641 [Galerina marginata CBS 339.88]|uniref:Uncharacterized protein n=1 Tax=Galerina marginata (strain CBS 339.88) TaxID=685588 RepID=A0A067SBS4_GALM3|nr:hypothetical protein GALMADRAFT_217641 [Galerina marginata CBS 339.88]